MNRRFVALLIMLAIGLQGPILAYASVASAKTMPSACAGQVLGHPGNDSNCCPQGIALGTCCAGGLLTTPIPSAPVNMPAPSHFVAPAPASVAFATERPTPLLRPPIA